MAVLEDIYGSGILNRGTWWPLICVAAPVLVTVAELIYSFQESLGSRGEEKKENMWEEAITVENLSIPRFFLLATFLSGCGIIFTQLVVCAQFPTPSMFVQVITSLLVTAVLIVAIWLFWAQLRKTLTWSEGTGEVESFDIAEDIKDWCGFLFGWCGQIRVSVEREQGY
jgi:hypothetical protein